MLPSIKIKKSLGQHFLRDDAVSSQIVNLLTDESLIGTVVEVGPGRGSLTDLLVCKAIANLYLVEVDRELIPYLKKRYPQLNGRIIAADFLALSLTEQFQGARLTIIGNFPYNISSQILFKILDNRYVVNEVVGMVQKEVAQRIAAKPGSKVYGMLSLFLQAFYTIEYHFTVPLHLFLPPPKVDSAVITMHRNGVAKLPCDEQLFFQIVKSGFQQRRKKLQNALRAFNISNISCPDLLSKRAEELSVAEFVTLTNALGAGR
ncbi:MAG: 16S rRNA (adenine(1518)-N(6)/adenine(1519)-N(6))-dimethyltransferase RsmA [Candidatus Cardinium sp.]|uniref:16S rRNA (adenine(1518)-N(6)/adenine(1519)-N(6))- dimethyltransferase RsmA n=1 Tax=Cardinium endosymbiont of Dermatophagoides farinae TaxID=2597823 RepID=UPI0011822A78|nr:16S rRNA (adenine(1518)-N(6)/adenine(1519)-N(6))-dimethyltransferase RsmA [Cardinium endosymbiont of Dermatophagoides farinae]TSJ81421.1 ribosomal RNA small subunit methyltransferase A [Cardinium endosymbiont of Dermatophagoides farinae]UWW97483.1 MAG: 16S rRNA (adenine(1518)-N(6)/adenine(1519)-N(6))-dimethyltransferase RsmA [Candidatus Cardinium sp.]